MANLWGRVISDSGPYPRLDYLKKERLQGERMKRERYMTMRMNPEERRQIEEVARLWGCRVTEVLRLCFRMVMLGEKRELAAGNRLSQEGQ